MSDIAIFLAERTPLPDSIIRSGMRSFISGVEREPDVPDAVFADQMAAYAIAEHTDTANAQHYELPPEFFTAFLGPHRKYSSCLYPTGKETLGEAEAIALAETCEHAALADGQQILELGCGWGSLSLWMASHYPGARITSVSNSAPQRLYIEGQAKARGLTNLTVITCDMNVFDPKAFGADAQFDRIVSVEMFEHMANWRPLLERVKSWLKPDGRFFIHIFTHPTRPSHYAEDESNWMAKHFFTGGIMPSIGLIRQYPDLFTVEQEWRWSGTNYYITAMQWLENFDRNRAVVDPILKRVYGAAWYVWMRRWRMFFLATAESFGYDQGRRWGLSHYRMAPV